MKSIRTRLIMWYAGSLTFIALFFWFVIHVYMHPWGVEMFVALVILFSTVGFFVIFQFIQRIERLTRQMKSITDKNLNERVTCTDCNDEVGQLTMTFNNLLERLHQAFQREHQFIADVAHEMKTPLATLKSSLELARERKYSVEDYDTSLNKMLKEIDELSDTLKDVLDLAWTENPKAHKSRKRFNLSSLMSELADIAEKLATQKKLKVETHFEPDILISGYREKLARAVLNLIDNAVKYTPKGGIDITLKKVKETVFILVKDTGSGIPKEELLHIFDRFYRGRKTDKVLGSGLGLAIAKSIVQLHGGTIEVDSKEGKGSVFVVSFPSS